MLDMDWAEGFDPSVPIVATPLKTSSNLSQMLGDLSITHARPPLVEDDEEDYDDEEASPRREGKSNRQDDRREKNREAARNSRQKKRQYMSVLEEQIKELSAHVLDLRAAHQVGFVFSFYIQTNQKVITSFF